MKQRHWIVDSIIVFIFGGGLVAYLSFIRDSHPLDGHASSPSERVMISPFPPDAASLNPTRATEPPLAVPTPVVSNGASSPCDNCLPNLDGECSASPLIAAVGQTIAFEASGTGGSGIYAYTWTGDDGLKSEYRAFKTSFPSSGDKKVAVYIFSNGQSVYRTCTVRVIDSRPVTVHDEH